VKQRIEVSETHEVDSELVTEIRIPAETEAMKRFEPSNVKTEVPVHP
jgi:hypothetical protein